MMRVLHVPFGYFPEVVGGTEVYVADLCSELTRMNAAECVVAAPGKEASEGLHDGIQVMRYPVSSQLSAKQMYGEGDPVAVAELLAVVAKVKPQVVHFHAYSAGIPTAVAEALHGQGMPLVYTYHTPTSTCARGTLLRWGSDHCEGEMKPFLCACCMMNGLGLSRVAAVSAVGLSAVLSAVPFEAGVKFHSYALTQLRTQKVSQWLGLMDRVVALGAWGREVLLKNGVPAEKLRIVRHGVPVGEVSGAGRERTDKTLRLVFLGRADPTKGLHLLLQALQMLPQAAVQLSLHTLAQAGSGAYAEEIARLCSRDGRVQLLPPVRREEVMSVMAEADAVVVPSLWFETGPLVVLEAFRAGVPVLGSGWGGIAEWVEDGVDGLLVREPTAEAWAELLQKLLSDPALLPRLRAGVRSPRTSSQVAVEMLSVYRELVPPHSFV